MEKYRPLTYSRRLSRVSRETTTLCISNHPNIRIKVPDLCFFRPRQLIIQRTATTLSPSTSTFSPPNRGFEPAPTTNAYALTTMPSRSRTLIETSLLPFTCSLSGDFAFRSNRHHAPVSNTLPRPFPMHRTLAYANGAARKTHGAATTNGVPVARTPRSQSTAKTQRPHEALGRGLAVLPFATADCYHRASPATASRVAGQAG